MKLSKSVSIIALALIIGALGALQAEARCPGMGACHGMGPMWFNLNDDQKQKAKELMVEYMKEKEALRAEMGKKKIELMELTSKDELDDAAIEKKLEELWAVKDKKRAAKREMGKKFRGLLTKEQKKEFGPLWMGFGGKGFGMGFGRGKGYGCGKGYGRGKGPHGSGPKCPYYKGSGSKTKGDSGA